MLPDERTDQEQCIDLYNCDTDDEQPLDFETWLLVDSNARLNMEHEEQLMELDGRNMG